MHRRYRSQFRGQRYSGSDFLMPFLILLCVGIIIILLINLWNALFDRGEGRAAFMHIVEGSVEFRTWGTDDYFSLSSDAVVMQGDELITNSGSRVVLEFFDGTLVRVDGASDISVVEVDEESSQKVIELFLVDGRIWVNKLYAQTDDTKLIVKTANVEFVSEEASIFAVESDYDESVRVIQGASGDVSFNVLSEDGASVLESDALGVGQQAVFSDEAIARYREFKSPSVISALDDEFQDSEWYEWNIAQDEDPVEFDTEVIGTSLVKVDPEETELKEIEEVEPEDAEKVEEAASEEEVVEEAATESGALEAPKVTSVGGQTAANAEGFYVVNDNPALIQGDVKGAARVVVNNYALQRYVAGDATWNYFANADYGLMKEGENVFEIHAEDAAGKKSAKVTIKVLYQPRPKEVAPVPQQPVVEEVQSNEEPVAEPTT